jgi:hypothetical protein
MAFNDDMAADETIKKLPSGQYQVSAEPVSVTAKRATPEEIAQYNRENPPTPYSGGSEATRALIGQGLGMGFGDEIEAGVRAPFSDETYKEIRDRLRAQQEQFGKDYPVTQTGLELIGGLAIPVAGIGLGARAALSAATRAGTLAKGVGIGAGSGAVTGAGTAKEMGDIPIDALSSGIVGAGVGGIAPSAINLTGRTVRVVADSLGLTNANKYASRKLAEKLDQDNLTPDDARIILEEYRRLGVPDPVLADLGDNLRGLGYAANVVPSKAKNATSEFLQERNDNLAGSLITGLEQKANVKSGGKFGFEYINELEQAQTQAARKAYPKAYQLDLPATPFRKFTDRQVFQDAYQNAVRRANTLGETPLPALEQIRNAQFINTNILHEIKKGLDAVIEKETDTLTGKMSSYGADVAKVKREFNDLIKYYNKDYRLANAKFADSEGLKSAYKDGLDYMKMDTNELLASLKKMKPSEKEAFRVGMLSQIKDKYSKSLATDITNLVFKSPRQKSALRYAFDSQSQFDDFVKQVSAQKELLKTSKRIQGGSTTQSNIVETEDSGMVADLLNTGAQVASGNIMGAATNLARRGAARAGGISPAKAEELQSLLFNPDPAGQNKILELLKQQAAQKANQNRFQQGLQTPATYSFGLGELQGLLGQ